MQAASAKRPGGMRTVTKLGTKSRTARRIREEGGALFVSQRKTRKLQRPSGAGATEQRTGKEHAAWDEERRCIWGVQAASLPICAKSELAAERMGNGKAKWQSEMAKRNGKSEIAKRNRKAKCGAKRTSALSHGPGGLRQSLRELREFGCWFCEGFRLNK